MSNRLVVGFGALVGAVVGYFLGQRGAAPIYAEIRIREKDGRCCADARPYVVHARQAQLISWDVIDLDHCLGEGTIEFRFVDDDSPLFDRRPRAKKRPNNKRFIEQSVTFRAVKGRAYRFDIWYVSNLESYKMADPEIQIEY